MIGVGLIVMFFITLEAIGKRGASKKKKEKILLLIASFCAYAAMQTPMIYYGKEDISGGAYNTNFLILIIFLSILMMVLADSAAGWLEGKENYLIEKTHVNIVIPGILFCMVLALLCRSDIKDTTTWICLDYIVTGQAADYKEQMIQLTELMTEEGVEDIVVPFINDIQGPLMHMPVTDNPEAWTNTVICQYYDKNSVVAMPRVEWEEQYGYEQK